MKFFQGRSNQTDSVLIRLFIEGELANDVRIYVDRMIQSNEAWRLEYERMQSYLHDLKALPAFEPPSRVWESIAKRIQQDPESRPWWFAWNHFWTIRKIAWSGVAVLLLVFVILMQYPYVPEYEVVNVKEVNGFGIEAETYVANHDLLSEEPITQEVLLAFFPIDNASMNEFDD